MALEDEKFIGYIRYCGQLVEDGLLDTRKSAQALLGFDEAIRFFVNCQSTEFKDLNFDLPVRIRQGSWEALIPDAIFWLKAVAGTAAGAAATAYSIKAAQKMAENDFDNIGLKTILRKSLEAAQWVIKIGKHLGTLGIKKFEHVKFRNNNTEIGLPNKHEEYLWVPKYYLDLFVKCPVALLAKMADLVEDERTLFLGLFRDEDEVTEEITFPYKKIFINDDDDVLFPELKHGMDVVLDGEVTRGNETSNSIGFKYKDHILTAHPETGSVVRYKPSLFLKAQITGVINRVDDRGGFNAKRPKIIFSNIVPQENGSENMSMFDKNKT